MQEDETFEEVATELLQGGQLEQADMERVIGLLRRMQEGVIPSRRDRDYLCRLQEQTRAPVVCRHLDGDGCAYKRKSRYFTERNDTGCGYTGRNPRLCEYFREVESHE